MPGVDVRADWAEGPGLEKTDGGWAIDPKGFYDILIRMADAIGKVTCRAGVCFVTRGPGATNASAGIHIAHQDSAPMIMFVGQVERHVRGREAFHELDY